MVPWRHSPLTPTTARTRMKKELVSDAKTSVSTEPRVCSVRTPTRTVIATEIAAAAPASATAVRACGA
jgi:hypothetical protein